ncbi:MAG: hypothetical protein HQK53_04255 [Oligoflexia bacterium]|nr:hypothetical protein [Oligoflexia bacterium]
MINIDQKTFIDITDFIYKKSGIVLRAGKESLVQARLSKRVLSLQLSSFKEYLHFLKESDSTEEIVLLLDAISTNVTKFFREKDHFDFLEEYIKKNINRKIFLKLEFGQLQHPLGKNRTR